MLLGISTFQPHWVTIFIFAVSFIQLASPSDTPSNDDTSPVTKSTNTTSDFQNILNRLDCERHAWMGVFTFFAVNYVGHAFTVRLKAGYGPTYSLFFGMTSLFLPYFGLYFACNTIERWAVSEKDNLRRALRGGALCVVARTKNWKPKPGDKVWCWRSPSQSSTGTTRGAVNRGTAKAELHGEIILEYLAQSFVQVHGVCILPEDKDLPDEEREYMLARLPSDYEVKWGTQENGDALPKFQANISSNYSVLNTLVALIQLGSAIPTILSVSRHQKTELGYAAYQLTVIPYALMSVLNTFASFTAPSYPASYLVHSEIMDEARRRGGVFEGVVGELCESNTPSTSKAPGAKHDKFLGAVGTLVNRPGENSDLAIEFEDGKERIQWSSEGKDSENILNSFFHAIRKAVSYVCRQQIWETLRDDSPVIRWVPRWHQHIRELRSLATEVESSDVEPSDAKEAVAHISSIPSPEPEPTSNHPHRANTARAFGNAENISNDDKPTILVPSIGNPVLREKEKREKILFYVADIIFVLSLAAPYLINFWRTGYKSGKSTIPQRVFTILWLVMMQLAWFPQRMALDFLQYRIVPLSHKKLIWAHVYIIVCGLLWAIPAIAGFITVGMMIRAESGSCIDYGHNNDPL